MAKKYQSIQERIVANSVLSFENGMMLDGEWSWCWDWIGAVITNRRGQRYPAMSLRWKKGPRKGKVYKALTHRIVIKEFKGRVMTHKMVAKHLCNNTMCVNPAHLIGGTQRSNVRQCVREGRHRNQYSDERLAA